MPRDAALSSNIETFRINIPAATIELIGRARAVRELCELLSNRQLVTLVGPGGIGKTTLAFEVAREWSKASGDGCLVVELAVLTQPSLVLSAIGSAIGLKQNGQEASAESIARMIGSRKLLLVLDNCEHVVDAVAELIEAILTRCEGVKVLATSRETLRLDNEQVYRVPPLDVPQSPDASLDDVLGCSSVELFVHRARALGADQIVDGETAAAIASICQRLDGIPLAIEFAAARSTVLHPARIAALLDDRLNLLTTGRRTALPRHQTLRAALDWSYNLLPDTEAQVLRHLAVFAGEFSLSAAASVTGLDRTAIADHVAGFVNKSLVVAGFRDEYSHYRLLETTRAYLLEKLQGCGEYIEAAQRLANYYTAELKTRLAPPSANDVDKLDRLIPHLANVRAALDWAFGSDGDVPTGAALTAAAVPLWINQSLFSECRERSELALAWLDSISWDDQHLRMQLSAALGWSLMYGVGRVREAGPLLETTLEFADRLGDRDYRLRALWGLCIDQFNNGDFRRALDYAERFASVTQGSEDPADQVLADRLLAVAFHYLGNQTKARYHIDHVAARLGTLGDRPRVFPLELKASTYYFRARILWLQGLADQATNLATQNIETGQNHALTFCSVLAQAACPIAYLAGDFDAAERYGQLLLDHTQRYAIRSWWRWADCFVAMVKARRGDLSGGLNMLRDALEGAGEARLLPRFLLPLAEFAALLGEAGEIGQGLATVEGIIERTRVRDERWYVAELLRIRGELLVKTTGHEVEAKRCFIEGIEIASDQGALFWQLRSALSLARLKADQGERSQARTILAPVFGSFTEGHWIVDLRESKQLLDGLRT